MKQIAIVFAILIGCCLTLSAQQPRIIRPSPIIGIPQGLPFTSFNSNGFLNVSRLHTGAEALTNPALLSNANESIVSVSFGFATEIESPISTVSAVYKERYPGLPKSALIAHRFGKLHIGLGFDQTYSSSLQLPPLLLRTLDDPDGTRFNQTLDPSTRGFSYSTSVLLAYQFVLGDASLKSIGLGLKVGFDRFENTIAFSSLGTRYEDNAASITAGALVNLGIAQMGFSYQHSPRFAGPHPDDGLLTFPDPSGEEQFQLNYPDWEAQFLHQVHSGASLKLGDSWQTAGNFSYLFSNEEFASFVDLFEMDVSLTYQKGALPMLTAALFYRTPVQDSFLSNTTFLSLGASKRFGQFLLDAVIADSHLLSDETVSQVVGRLGVGVSF